jgi:hypothetical protein
VLGCVSPGLDERVSPFAVAPNLATVLKHFDHPKGCASASSSTGILFEPAEPVAWYGVPPRHTLTDAYPVWSAVLIAFGVGLGRGSGVLSTAAWPL